MYDVLIIGAGVSGLVAAKTLQDQGLNVLIVEAQGHIGGRATSEPWHGINIDLGAEFVHGEHTITAQLARDMHLNTISIHENTKLIDNQGNQLDQASHHAFDKAFDYVATNGRPGISVADLLDTAPIDIDPIVRDLVAIDISDYEASDASQIDSGAFASMIQKTAHNGQDVMLQGGYSEFIRQISANLPVQLNSLVSHIDYSSGEVTITLAEGSTLHAKCAILTVSLGVLKSESIKFTPIIPANKATAIKQLGMGNAMKLLLRFRNPHDVSELFHIADGDNASLQTITSWWASACDPSVLVGFTCGSRAARVLAVEPSELVRKVTKDLQTLVRFDVEKELLDYKIVRWDLNPYTIGAYSFHPVSTSDKQNTILAQPTPPLFWAGEATVDNGNYATVHGAIESGFRVADEILSSGAM